MNAFDNVALVMSGGSALGSYQAGAWEALQEHGIAPDWIVGTSAGAINGAIICGSEAEHRLARLAEFWQPAPRSDPKAPTAWSHMQETARRTIAAAGTLAYGRPGVFAPYRPFGAYWDRLLGREQASLYDARPLSDTLEHLVDFDRLNAGCPRLQVTAVDVRSGEDVVFDTDIDTITSAHVRASSALMPVFPPVEVAGRLLADAGLSANLPIDAILANPPAGKLLCIALDLLPQAAPEPTTLGETTNRVQDLIFASQSRRTLAAWQTIFDERTAKAQSDGETPSIMVLRLAYSDQSYEVSGKAFDFSALSARARWNAGHKDMGEALALMNTGQVTTGQPGLTVFKLEREPPEGLPVLRPLRKTLTPAPGSPDGFARQS